MGILSKHCCRCCRISVWATSGELKCGASAMPCLRLVFKSPRAQIAELLSQATEKGFSRESSVCPWR
eukprot:4619650-Alexandrium_andersonii.AAC.1